MKTLSVVMAASNPVTMEFPLRECILSALPAVDEIILINGDNVDLERGDQDFYISEVEDVLRDMKNEYWENYDDSFECAWYSGKIKRVFLPWKESFRKNMESLAKSAAISQATKDYVLLLDCDEVLHEEDYDKIKQCMEIGKDAYSFRTLHFYRDYKHYKIAGAGNGYWYNHRPKLFKNGLGIWDGYQSWIDKEGKLHTEYTADLITWDYKPVHSFSVKTSITCYHYGYVRSDKAMLAKHNAIEKRYHPDHIDLTEFNWDMSETAEYTGTHPKVMEDKINEYSNYRN